jgi:hypothetical protein
MKRLALLLVALLSACVTEPKITVCSGEHWWNCTHYDSEAEYAADNRKATARAVAEAKDIDIDYDDCAAVVLKDLIGPDAALPDRRIYIIAPGGGPSEKLLALLRKEGIRAEPKSMQDYNSAGNNGDVIYGMSLLSTRFFGGYEAQAGYFCGMLCSATMEYRLKKAGSSCAIVSKEQLRAS